MKDDIKKKRLAEMLGIAYVPDVPETPKEKEKKQNVSREAEAAIGYLRDPSRFIERPCINCGKHFAVDRGNIALCTDSCRTNYLSEKFGLDVDLSLRTPAERWAQNTGGPEPLIVPPLVLTVIQSRLVQTTPPVEEVPVEEESHLGLDFPIDHLL